MNTFKIENKKIYTIDQTKIPEKLEYIELDSSDAVYSAIKEMNVRGAPAIGIAAAFGVYLAATEIDSDLNGLFVAGENCFKDQFLEKIKDRISYLNSARPTAVNLIWATKRMFKLIEEKKATNSSDVFLDTLFKEAKDILEEDINLNQSIGLHGSKLIKPGMNILTHCNAGSLATGGHGTALGIIRTAFFQGKNIKVFADETRPRLQGARLTVWELQQENIPVTLISDNMAGYLMSKENIDCVIVGADRITRKGHVANKIGTYSVAVLAKYHNIPFYVAAPYSTIDVAISEGKDIIIEERDKKEVLCIGNEWLAAPNTNVFNPAFDTTPPELITSIITEEGVFEFPYNFL